MWLMSTILYASSQWKDRYRPHFYLASLGGIAGTVFCFGWESALDIIPADITITLLLSSVFHDVYQPTEPGRDGPTDEKTGGLYHSLLPR
jgi:hypothetical protein